MDNRAQSIGISRYILSLIAGAFITWIVWEVGEPILAGARETTNNSTANQATTWFEQGMNWMPIAFLLIATLGIIILSVFAREVLR